MCFTRERIVRSVLAVGIVMLIEVNLSNATIISMTASDTSGTSSFNAAGKWSDGLAPSATNDYLVGSLISMRTPVTASNYTFAGNSLTVSNGFTYNGLSYLGTGNTTLTVNDLRLDNGNVNNSTTAGPLNLAGHITLGSGNGYFNMNSRDRKINVLADISGVGSLTAWQYSALAPTTGGVFLKSTNSYSGGTIVASYGLLDAQKDGALGTGNVTVAANGKLVLDSGLTNNYIDDTADLVLANATEVGMIKLNFTGADTIASLSFDGGTSYAAAGTWGAVGSGAAHTSAVFSGTGMLNIVPEPSAVLLLTTGLFGLLAYAWRRRKCVPS